MSPFFSIIIPCYNQAHFLPDCLESLLKQEFQDWEAIIVNDGSPDDTNEVAKRFTDRDSRIKLTEKKNGGLSSARNFGISQAVGERYIFLDADDFLYLDCREKIYRLAEKSNDFDLIQCGYSYITEDKKRVLGLVNAVKKNSLVPEIFKRNLGPCHSICISKKLALAIGTFDEQLRSVEDWDFWMRAIKAGGKQKIIQESLVYYRYSKNSMSRNPFIMFEAFKMVIARGPKKDFRITIDSILNKDYDFDVRLVLQEVLIQSMGVGIVQGKIQETLALFHIESTTPLKEYNPHEFESMCSYLSFRYWYSRGDIEEVFTSVYPNFVHFFKEAGYDSGFTKEALYHIFKRHLNYRNRYRYGKLMGQALNYLNRFYQETVKF